jgi:hypothetical protein
MPLLVRHTVIRSCRVGGAPRTETVGRIMNSVTTAFDLASFMARCADALAVVQGDLDRTGYGDFKVYPANLVAGENDEVAEDDVIVYASIEGHGGWSSGPHAEMTPGMNDIELLKHAALSVSDTLQEVLAITWPRCTWHNGLHMTLSPTIEEPWWWCPAIPGPHPDPDDGHGVARVGELAAKDAILRGASHFR